MEDNLYAPPKAKLESGETTLNSIANAKRPASHIVVAIYFTMATAVLFLMGSSSVRTGAQGYVQQFGTSAAYAIALVSLIAARAKWAYIVVAFCLFVFPAFLLAGAILILFKVKDVPFVSILPMIVGSGLLFWPFYAFAVGSASRAYYGFSQSSAK